MIVIELWQGTYPLEYYHFKSEKSLGFDMMFRGHYAPGPELSMCSEMEVVEL
jgi:hypothetical protein